jgi:hypothetical protein
MNLFEIKGFALFLFLITIRLSIFAGVISITFAEEQKKKRMEDMEKLPVVSVEWVQIK